MVVSGAPPISEYLSTGMMIEVGEALLGRVVDPFMNPIDGKGPVSGTHLESIIKAPIAAMKRGMSTR